MLNIEELVIGALNDAGQVAYADVPADSSGSFHTVELTGETRINRWLVTLSVAVQSWAPTRYEASELALQARQIVLGIDAPDVTQVMPDTFYYFGADDGSPRYQAVYEFTVNTD